jgi:hypothetical protein
MPPRTCPYCCRDFTPSRFHPDQVVCSDEPCQRRRRADYHKQKIKDDPAYRETCRDSQRLWLERNPGYMRAYGKKRRNAGIRIVDRLLELIKNNLALEIRHCHGEAWIAVPTKASAKKTFASAEVILFEIVAQASPDGRPEKNNLLAVPVQKPYK